MATSILIVEDEPEIRELLNFSLVRAGFDVAEAASGEMAADHREQTEEVGLGFVAHWLRGPEALGGAIGAAGTHGTLPWRAAHQRRAVLYKYSPSHMSLAASPFYTHVPPPP